MTFMEQAIDSVLPIWEDCLNTPFVQELKEGTLPLEKFKQYIIQDSIYLKHYARVFGLGIYQSKTLKEIQMYYSMLNFVNATETATRNRFMAQFDLTDDLIEGIEPLAENAEYYEFMLAMAATGDNRALLMAVLPCMISYNVIFRKAVADPVAKNSQYWDFMADYIGEPYTNTCKVWSDYCDEQCLDATEEEKKRFLEIFEKSSLLEVDFWNMCYRAL